MAWAGGVLRVVVYGRTGNLPIPLVPSRSETGRRLSVTPQQFAVFFVEVLLTKLVSQPNDLIVLRLDVLRD